MRGSGFVLAGGLRSRMGMDKPFRDEFPGCGPFGGAYHRRCLPALDRVIRDKQFKMRDLVPDLEAELRMVDAIVLANVNTPAELDTLEERTR